MAEIHDTPYMGVRHSPQYIYYELLVQETLQDNMETTDLATGTPISVCVVIISHTKNQDIKQVNILVSCLVQHVALLYQIFASSPLMLLNIVM